MRTRLKTDADIAILEEGGKILMNLLIETANQVRSGITTLELNKYFEEGVSRAGARPAFKGYKGFPAGLCTSVNDEVVHGIPSARILKDGDCISIDAGLLYKNLYTDAAITVPVGNVDKKIHGLIDAARGALTAGIDAIHDGVTTGDIGNAIETYVSMQGSYGIVRDYTGHGVGYSVHEDPPFPNFGRKGMGVSITKGMVFCLEPMIMLGDDAVYITKDHWTVKTMDGSVAAHFEHTIAIDSDGQVRIITRI